MKLFNLWMFYFKCLVLDLFFFLFGDDLYVVFLKGLKWDGIVVVIIGSSN